MLRGGRRVLVEVKMRRMFGVRRGGGRKVGGVGLGSERIWIRVYSRNYDFVSWLSYMCKL